jgi:hypothetical protein
LRENLSLWDNSRVKSFPEVTDFVGGRLLRGTDNKQISFNPNQLCGRLSVIFDVKSAAGSAIERKAGLPSDFYVLNRMRTSSNGCARQFIIHGRRDGGATRPKLGLT